MCMNIRRIAGVALLLLLAAGCLYDRAPAHRRVEMAFFACGECRSLEGGNYGKGPIRKFRSHKAGNCAHTWRRLTQTEFESLATRWFGFDWSAETRFWTGTSPGVGEASVVPANGR
jgi:hypothetical protein